MMENTANPLTATSKSVKHQVKRDEWSEVAVTSLLQAYEAKWLLRNRAKLKGQDWVEVARFVSNASDAPKTQTQCKNKIESMKKRYRSESTSTSSSTWPLYEKIHHLMTGHSNIQSAGGVDQFVSLDQSVKANCSPPEDPPLVPFSDHFPVPTGQNENAPTKLEEEEAKLSQSDQSRHDKTTPADSSSTNPAFQFHIRNKLRKSSSNPKRRKKNKMQSYGIAIAESVRWLAEAVVRTEETRMETMRELERMRAETEIKRGEMELKRTQIIADTQLEIARLMSGNVSNETRPSFRPGPS